MDVCFVIFRVLECFWNSWHFPSILIRNFNLFSSPLGMFSISHTLLVGNLILLRVCVDGWVSEGPVTPAAACASAKVMQSLQVCLRRWNAPKGEGLSCFPSSPAAPSLSSHLFLLSLSPFLYRLSFLPSFLPPLRLSSLHPGCADDSRALMASVCCSPACLCVISSSPALLHTLSPRLSAPFFHRPPLSCLAANSLSLLTHIPSYVLPKQIVFGGQAIKGEASAKL